jgi:hypothetical protein
MHTYLLRATTLSVDWIANDERATGFGSSEFNFLERSQIVQVLKLPDGVGLDALTLCGNHPVAIVVIVALTVKNFLFRRCLNELCGPLCSIFCIRSLRKNAQIAAFKYYVVFGRSGLLTGITNVIRTSS